MTLTQSNSDTAEVAKSLCYIISGAYLLWKGITLLRKMFRRLSTVQSIRAQFPHAGLAQSTWEAATKHTEGFPTNAISRSHTRCLQQMQNESAARLKATLQYTCTTFTRLGFKKQEIEYICHCDQTLLTEQRICIDAAYRLPKHPKVTQIDLKNFTWNIGNLYGISGGTRAQFVYHTFQEWFLNTTISCIEKTLKTRRGSHAVAINEHLLEQKI
jgi:hypothetical protein